MKNLRHLWDVERDWSKMTTYGERLATLFGSRGPATSEEHAVLLEMSSGYQGSRGMIRMLPIAAGALLAVIGIYFTTGDFEAGILTGSAISVPLFGYVIGRRFTTLHRQLTTGLPPTGPAIPTVS